MKKHLGTLGILFLVARLFAEPGLTPRTPALHVALMDFMSEDNSYRSTVALEDLVSAVQVEVSRDTDYVWVERAELGKAVDEFRLAGLGLVDRSEAIRSGRWVGADWGVFGDVSTNFNGRRTLALEIVDLPRADVLASTNLSLPTTGGGPFETTSEHVSQVAATLRTLLKSAQEIYSHSEKQGAIAFLFLSHNGFGNAYGELENEIRHSLFAESTNSQRFHLIQFQRAGAALEEADLVLGGLAETDSNAWERVADSYVWGDAQEKDGKNFDWKTRAWRDEQMLNVKLNVWGGRVEPQTVILAATNESPAAVARKLVQALEPLLRRDESKPIVENVRDRISDSIFARYAGLPMNFSFDSPEGRRQWFDAVQLLETACFFNPGNAAAREQLLRLRWGTALPAFNKNSPAASEELNRLGLSLSLKSASRNEFFFARRRSEAWGKYVEQFGFKTALPKTNSPSIAAEYLLSAWRPFEMFGFAQENQAQWGVPRDAGLRELTEWENQFGSEFVSRIEVASDDPAFAPYVTDFFYHSLGLPDPAMRSRAIRKLWPRIVARARMGGFAFDEGYRYALKRHFEEIGQPGGDQKLLAQVEAPAQGEGSKPTNNPPTTQSVRLPRVAELESTLTEDIFSVRPIVFSPPLVEPDIQTIPFPAGIQVKGVKSMVFHNHTLWLAVEVSEPLELRTVNSRIENEFQPVSVDHVHLWKLDADAGKLEPVAGSLATNNINSMMARGDTLWLALDDQGIAALNVKTGDVRRYESSAGINATNQFELGDTSREIAAIGGMNDLSILENGTETWKPLLPGIPYQNFILGGDARRLAGQKDKLLLYNSQLLLLDLNSKKWTRIADSAVLEEIGHIRCLVGDGRGNFWIASSSGLHSVNPDTGRIRSQWIAVPPTIPVAVGAALPGQGQRHKTDAQLIPEVRQKLELRRRLLAARKSDTNQPELFVPSSRLPAGVLSVATDDDFLWVFTADATHPLLYHPDSHSWVGGFSIRHMGAPSTLTCGDGKLWLATAQGDRFAILKVNTSPLKSTPRERWLTDAISQEELSARVSEMSEHERAVYLFFAGNDEAVIQLLQTRSEDVLGPESLFLLASAFSEIGQPAQAAHFGKKLAAEFPGSVYTTLISYDRRLMVTRMKIEQSLKTNPRPESTDADAVSAWMMRVLDADGDGALEQNELAIFFELEPEQTQRLVFNSSLKPAAAAAELIQRFDRNRDERLQRNELTDVIRSTAFLRGWPRSSRTNQPVHHPTQTTNQ